MSTSIHDCYHRHSRQLAYELHPNIHGIGPLTVKNRIRGLRIIPHVSPRDFSAKTTESKDVSMLFILDDVKVMIRDPDTGFVHVYRLPLDDDLGRVVDCYHRLTVGEMMTHISAQIRIGDKKYLIAPVNNTLNIINDGLFFGGILTISFAIVGRTTMIVISDGSIIEEEWFEDDEDDE